MAHACLFGSNATANPFSPLLPSSFPPGTDQNVVKYFLMADQDNNGCVDDKELRKVLSSCNHSFSLQTVRLLMHVFTKTNARKIGPREFAGVYNALQGWRDMFEKYDKNRNGVIDCCELGEALRNLGFNVTPAVLDALIRKYDQSGDRVKAIGYDHFIECCLTIKGLTENFKQHEKPCSGSATFTYETFLLTVLPIISA